VSVIRPYGKSASHSSSSSSIHRTASLTSTAFLLLAPAFVVLSSSAVLSFFPAGLRNHQAYTRWRWRCDFKHDMEPEKTAFRHLATQHNDGSLIRGQPSSTSPTVYLIQWTTVQYSFQSPRERWCNIVKRFLFCVIYNIYSQNR
jgi:hypothetical protein